MTRMQNLERAPEDGRRYELYDGEPYVVPAPMPRHQRVQIRLVEWLDEYVARLTFNAVADTRKWQEAIIAS